MKEIAIFMLNMLDPFASPPALRLKSKAHVSKTSCCKTHLGSSSYLILI